MGTSTSGGLPIRLVRRDGDLIYLHCTDYNFSINRSVPAIPIPALGERIGADLNLVMVDIRLNCILTDDDCLAAGMSASSSSATIDFSARDNFEETGNERAIDTLMSDDGGEVTIANLNGKSFTVKTKHQENTGVAPITVLFDTSVAPAASSAATNILTAGLNGVANTGAALATALNTAFTAHGGAFSPAITSTGGTSFGSGFTVAAPTTGANSNLGNCLIKLTQTEIGVQGDSGTPFFWTDADTAQTQKPRIEAFSGGSDSHSCRSAADKMQDLIGSIGNSLVNGEVGSAFNFTGSSADKGDWHDTDFKQLTKAGTSNDYIVGLQIPYNSLLHAPTDASLLPNGYGTRNFLLVTGLTTYDMQNALGNTNPASVVFDSQALNTGIRGTITQCNFSYSGSETTYSAELTFQPIDQIFGM
tara:strand:- start:455 stop:1708 length:1254 start_codon:yes stop_codon:yes gene_type:complete